MALLHGQGKRVRGVCRSGRSTAPEGVEILAGDLGHAETAVEITEGADVVFCCVGVDYTRWQELWPPIIDSLLMAAAGRKLVFADNLYSYGPVDGVMTEDLPLTGYGVKPALRARFTETLLGAHAEEKLRVALVRASDFYGPGVRNAMLGERIFPMALKGRPAQVLGNPDCLHTFTYAPDFAAAMITVADNEDAFGQIWHTPNDSAQTTRNVIEKIYALAGHQAKIQAMPGFLLAAMGLFNPMLRELKEMSFLWDRSYVVDDSKFRQQFDLTATPLDEGLQQTLDWYRARL